MVEQTDYFISIDESTLVNKHFKHDIWSIIRKDWEFQCQIFQNSTNLIVAIISNVRYFVRLSHWNIQS